MAPGRCAPSRACSSGASQRATFTSPPRALRNDVRHTHPEGPPGRVQVLHPEHALPLRWAARDPRQRTARGVAESSASPIVRKPSRQYGGRRANVLSAASRVSPSPRDAGVGRGSGRGEGLRWPSSPQPSPPAAAGEGVSGVPTRSEHSTFNVQRSTFNGRGGWTFDVER